MGVITITTDFGTKDWFVSVMKAVILNINPEAKVIDITHDIPLGDIKAAAFVIKEAYKYFPQDTIHLVVVDPGVGTERHPIVVKTSRYYFVGPDNGVFSYALSQEKVEEIFVIQNNLLFFSSNSISNTFHGRDIFAPVAAHLSKGLEIHKIGSKLQDYKKINFPLPCVVDNTIMGEVIYCDKFGNVITNISKKDIPSDLLHNCSAVVQIKTKKIKLHKTYQNVKIGNYLAYFGSSGYLEIARNGGSAQKCLKIYKPYKVIVKFKCK